MVSAKFDPVKDIKSQAGKVIFVTGGAIVFEPNSCGLKLMVLPRNCRIGIRVHLGHRQT